MCEFPLSQHKSYKANDDYIFTPQLSNFHVSQASYLLPAIIMSLSVCPVTSIIYFLSTVV